MNMNIVKKEEVNIEKLHDEQILYDNEKFMKKSSLSVEKIRKKINSKNISIRISEKVLEDLKEIAENLDLGYQTLINQILKESVKDLSMQLKQVKK